MLCPRRGGHLPAGETKYALPRASEMGLHDDACTMHHQLNHRGWAASAHRRPGRRLLLALCILPLLGGLFVSTPPSRVSGDELSDAIAKQKALAAAVTQQKNQIAQLTAQQTTLSTQLASTKTALDSVNANLTTVKAQVADMVSQIAKVKASYNSLVTQLASLDAQLVQVEGQESDKLAQLKERQGQLADRIRNAYDGDRTSILETLLSGGTFTDVLSEVSYNLDIGQQQKVLAQQIAEDQAVLVQLHQSVVTARQQTEALRQVTAQQKVQLDADLAALKAAQAKLKALEIKTAKILAAQQAAYAKMAATKSNLATIISQELAAQKSLAAKISDLVAAQAQSGSIPSSYNGTFIWPMRGTITQEFGCTGFLWEPPLGSCAHFHTGIDIANVMYTPIRAAAAGVVVFAGANPYDSYPKAWIVIIAHSSNLETWYAHVDNSAHPPPVWAGEHVSQGQIVAYEGMTGHTTGPHLHWAVMLNSNWVNPRLFL
jgi:murein DD-endopeptidase MepM/ murein hydrolase activator NlpD